MPFIRTVVERLLLMVLGVVRVIFLLQGLAFASAAAAAFAAAPAEAPAWLRSVMISALLLSVTFFVAGLCMLVARRWRVPLATERTTPASSWPRLLGSSLVALAVVAAIAANDLPAMWNRIAAQLAAIGFWEGMARPGQYGGIVLLPIFLALLVPALVSAAACFSIVFPLALIPLLATRSQLFPTLLAMGTICQAALVLSGWIATDAFAGLAAQTLAAMATSGDAEVLSVAGDLERETGILTRTAIALVAPMLGMLAWLAFLRPSGAAAGYFADGSNPAQLEAFHVPTAESAPSHTPIPVAPVHDVLTESAASRSRIDNAAVADEPAARSDTAKGPREAGRSAHGAHRGRVALALLGALMLLFAGADRLRTRPSYVSSQPAPGATLPDAPAALRVTFGAEIDPASALYLTRLVVQPSADEVAQEIEVVPRLAPHDPEHRTIEAVPSRLSAGLYHVTWQALPAGGGVPRHGSFSFGVGTSVPADTTGMTHSLQDRDAGARGRRQIVIGGILLLGLSALLMRRSPRV